MILINGVEINPTLFPDGTSQVEGLDSLITFENEIVLDFENEREIIQLLQILDYCESCYNHKGFYGKTKLYMPFMPYGRQDKNLSEDYFAKGTFTRLLKKYKFLQEVTSLDIHSNKNDYVGIKNIDPVKEISKTLIGINPDLICYPDKGAKTRYKTLSILEDFESCSFTKERDQKTGYIKRLYLNELVDVTNKSVLIIDDICDGGMTFKLTAERLLELGAKDVHLYVSHGIFSKGLETLRESGINRIFTHKGEV